MRYDDAPLDARCPVITVSGWDHVPVDHHATPLICFYCEQPIKYENNLIVLDQLVIIEESLT